MSFNLFLFLFHRAPRFADNSRGAKRISHLGWNGDSGMGRFILNPDQVAELRRLRGMGYTLKGLAKMFGIAWSTVRIYAEPWVRQDMRNKEKIRAYGLTEATYALMVESQGGACAICREVPDRLVVDHNHVSGLVRGLLCHTCNVAIGMFHESATKMQQACEYLAWWREFPERGVLLRKRPVGRPRKAA